MKVSINEATTLQLDYLMAKVEKRLGIRVPEPGGYRLLYAHNEGYWDLFKKHHKKFSESWHLVGATIAKTKMTVGWEPRAKEWIAVVHLEDGPIVKTSPTPLIAAMRCYVASKLGDEVEIPEELR